MRQPARVLIVTDRTEATPALLRAVRERAQKAPVRFVMLVPNPASAECIRFTPSAAAR